MPRVLLQLVDSQPLQEFPLEHLSVCRIGRGEQNTISLSADGRVSRSHALVQRMDTGEYYLSDLGSRNGTVLNGRLVISPTPLRDGDRIRLGSCELLFVQEQDPFRALAQPELLDDNTAALVDLRLVSVLVLDIRDYTGLSRRLGEVRTSQMMGSVFRDAGLALAECGSYAQKYLGDAVMSIWVHSGDHPSQADLRSVLNALCLLAQLVENMQRDFALPSPVRFGAGINCGVASLGNMGSSALADHTAMGECVNKAFRLESASKLLDSPVVFGESAYDFLDVLPGIRAGLHPRTVQLRGYAEPELVYVADAATLREVLSHC